ncbi:MAG: hypothetical protein ACETWG_08020 [Candidatus Neomarinimicrobiota bacterium]
MRTWLLMLVLLMSTLAAAEIGDETQEYPGGSILTAATLKQAGITRIADLLQLLTDWSLSSTDGYSWRASVNGLSSFQNQSWSIFLDGHKIDLRFLDFHHLNMLPVVIDDIDYVEVISMPQLYCGEYSDGGIIHIHTREPPVGLTVKGNLLLGNETGDPGPYLFTEYATPNVDRIANDGSLSIAWGSGYWYARANLIIQKHSFSDVAMLRRNSSLIDDWPGLHNAISPSLGFGIEAFRGVHDIFIGFPYTSKYFFYFGPSGREIPVNSSWPHFGLNGEFFPASRTSMRYRLLFSGHQIDMYPNTLDFDFDWRKRSIYADVEMNFRSASYRTTIGAAYDRFMLDTDYPLENDTFALYKIYGNVNHQLSKSINQNVSAFLVFNGKDIALKTAVAHTWDIKPDHTLRFNLAVSQRLLEEDNSLWYWIERGYGILETAGIEYTLDGDLRAGKQIAADLMLASRFARGLRIETALSYRKFSDRYWIEQHFVFNPDGYSVTSPLEIHTRSKGQVLGARMAVLFSPTPKVTQRISLGYQSTAAGNNFFKDGWGAVPKYRANYQFIYVPVESFSIWTMVGYVSPATWREYENIDGRPYLKSSVGNFTYSSTIGGSVIIDFKAEKKFWEERLMLAILLRNLLNQDHRYHPFGSAFDFSLFLQVKVLLAAQ